MRWCLRRGRPTGRPHFRFLASKTLDRTSIAHPRMPTALFTDTPLQEVKVDIERRWTCSQCGSLLAVDRADRLHVKIRKLHYIIDGSDFRVTAICRHCGTVTETMRRHLDRADVWPAPTPETRDVQEANEAHRRPARKAERNDRPMES